MLENVPRQPALGNVPVGQPVLGNLPRQPVLGNLPGQPVLGNLPRQPALGKVPGQPALGKVPDNWCWENQLLTNQNKFWYSMLNFTELFSRWVFNHFKSKMHI